MNKLVIVCLALVCAQAAASESQNAFFSWFSAKAPAAADASNATKITKLLKGPVPLAKQNSERTFKMAQEDKKDIIHIADQWTQLETTDVESESQVKQEDEAMNDFATTHSKEKPHVPSKLEISHVAGPHISGFWSKMEEEDDEIKSSLVESDSDSHFGNLDTYNKLTMLQNGKVAKAQEDLADDHIRVRTFLKSNDKSFESKFIHEPFAALQATDDENVKTIHDTPELQMMQTGDSLRKGHLHLRK